MDKPPKHPPSRPGDSRRQQIAAAALRCMQRGGYASLTARKIAQEAGLSLGHITYHFKDMDEVLSETYRHASTLLQAATLKHLGQSSGDPRDRLQAFLRAGFTAEFLDLSYLRVRVDLWSAALTHETIARTEQELYERYRQNLETLLTDINPNATERIAFVADAVMAMLDGLWLDWVRRRDTAAIANGLAACMLLAETLRSPAAGISQP